MSAPEQSVSDSFVSGPGALCVGARPSFYRAPALFVRVCGARIVSVSELGALRRSLYQGRALSGGLSVSGPGALCRRARRCPVVVSLFL